MSGMHGVQRLFDGAPQLVPGALRGYRSWAGVTVDGRLRSTGMTHTWQPAPFAGVSETARCLRPVSATGPEHPAPGHQCPCGLYGWYAPTDLRIAPGVVAGVVQASGRVILGTHGFRAERLEVLAVTAESDWMRAELTAAGYPVFETREAMLEAFPADDVRGLVDHVCDARCTDPLAGSLVVNLIASAQRFQAEMHRVAQIMASSSQQILDAFTALAAAGDGQDDVDTRSLRQRALDARRSRGTGPRSTIRAPRSLGVGGR